ncbi:hypothetical protein GCM10027051_25530 [Niabella terrae]
MSCDKSQLPTPQSNCQIIGLKSVKEHGQPSITRIHYNDDGSLDSANFTYDFAGYTSQASWSYEPGRIIQIWQNDNKIVNKKQIALDAKGKPIKMVIDFYDNNGVIYHTNEVLFAYNGQGQLIKSTLKNGDNPETATLYSWTGTNMTKAVGENDTETYTYYTDLPPQQLDYRSLVETLHNGVEFYSNQHLLKSWTSTANGFVRTYDYQFDPDGKMNKYIMKETKNGNTENTEVSLEYLCQK